LCSSPETLRLVTSTMAAPAIMRTTPATVKITVPMPPVDGRVEPELFAMVAATVPVASVPFSVSAIVNAYSKRGKSLSCIEVVPALAVGGGGGNGQLHIVCELVVAVGSLGLLEVVGAVVKARDLEQAVCVRGKRGGCGFIRRPAGQLAADNDCIALGAVRSYKARTQRLPAFSCCQNRRPWWCPARM
jgi:hypothetical protein